MAGVMRSETLLLFILKNTIQMPEGLLLFSHVYILGTNLPV